MKTLDNISYPPVERCIYCGNQDDLRKEHILPYGLGGTAILPKATCACCAKITGAIEQKVLRGPMWALRVYRRLQSRRKHRQAPMQYPLVVEVHGQEQQISLPLEEYPILLNFPVFDLPGFYRPNAYSKGIDIKGIYTLSFGKTPQQVAEEFGAERIKIVESSEPVAFAQMIAKIAYAWAVAERRITLDKGFPPVVKAILGITQDIGRWVGTIAEPISKYEGHLHRILVHEDPENRMLIGEVHLFSDSESPRYGVLFPTT
jgi:hypothetical protein